MEFGIGIVVREQHNHTLTWYCARYCCILFLIHMSIVDLCNKSCSAGRLAWQKLNRQTFQPIFFFFFFFYNTCHAYRHHGLLPLYTTFTDLDICWGSQGNCKAKPLSFNFSHVFQLIRVKFDIVLKLLKLNNMTLVWMRVNVEREIITVLWTASKKH